MFEDKVLKHKRAEGYYRRNAELGNVDGVWKNFVESNKAPDPSSMKLAKYIPRHEMDNMNTKDLEQTPDSVLKPGETLEDFDVTFRRPNADGGVQQLVQNTVDGSRPGYKGENKISFQDQHRTSGGTYKKMYSMEDIRKLGKELNVSEYNKKTGIKLTSEEYRAVVNNSKSRFNFYKNQFDSFSPKKKKAYMEDFNKQLVKHKKGGYYISTDARVSNAKFVKKYFPNATGGSKIVTSINGMLLKNFVNKGNVIKTSPKADANAIRIEELRKITNPTWETSTGVQGSGGTTLQHVASKNQMVKLNNLAYLEKKANSSLSQNDKRIKIIENEVDRLIKTKPKNYVERVNALNNEGMKLASGYKEIDGKIVKGSTAGYSEFRVKDPLNGKLSYFGKDESKMLLPDKDSNLIQKDSDLIGKNIKDMNADELKRAKQIAIDKQKEFKTLIENIGKKDPKLAQKVSGVVFNSGLPVDQMLKEIRKIPGIDKLGRGFMKVGGPFEVAIVGLDAFNEFSKGKTGKQSLQTSLSNLSFGLYEGGKREDMEVLLNTAENLNLDTAGFNELKEILDLKKTIEKQKKAITNDAYYEDEAFLTLEGGQGSSNLEARKKKLTELENTLESKSIALQENVDIDSLVKNYTQAVDTVIGNQYEKSKESRADRVYPEMGSMGSDFMTTIMNPIQSFLPQNLMETNSITRPYIRAAQKIPFIGDFFKPTSDAAILSATSKDDRIKKAEKSKGVILDESSKTYYAEGGLAGLMKKYYD